MRGCGGNSSTAIYCVIIRAGCPFINSNLGSPVRSEPPSRHMTIYLDSHVSDAERRRRLYAGDAFVYSPRPATLALTEFARELIEEAFAPLNSQNAQDSLPVERFVEIV